MLDAIIVICAMFGLAFFFKESNGPWDIMSKLRNVLMRNKYIGVFFYKLLDCYFCVGFHCGWMVYLLHEQSYKWQFFILWGLTGGVAGLIFDGLLGKLHASQP